MAYTHFHEDVTLYVLKKNYPEQTDTREDRKEQT